MTTTPSNPLSFESMYETYHIPIRSYLTRLVGDREQAEDLTQDTFLKAFRALPRMDAHLKVAAWLYRIATNTAYDALRRRKFLAWCSLQDLEYEPADVESADPQEGYATSELVRTALRCMPKKYRTALLMQQEGFTYREIAQAVNIAPTGVKMHLSRARSHFKTYHRQLREQTESSSQAGLLHQNA